MKKIQKGFTLIELLIVIAIIGILAGVILVSTSSAKNKATASATKQSLASLKSNIAVCCASGGTVDIQAATNAQVIAPGGRDICTTAIGAKFPTPTDLKLGAGGTVNYTVPANGGCNGTNGDPEIDVVLTGHPSSSCNTTTWTLKAFGGVTAPTGC